MSFVKILSLWKSSENVLLSDIMIDQSIKLLDKNSKQ